MRHGCLKTAHIGRIYEALNDTEVLDGCVRLAGRVIESNRSGVAPAAMDSKSARMRCISSTPCCRRTGSSWRPGPIGKTDTTLVRLHSMGPAEGSLS